MLYVRGGGGYAHIMECWKFSQNLLPDPDRIVGAGEVVTNMFLIKEVKKKVLPDHEQKKVVIPIYST